MRRGWIRPKRVNPRGCGETSTTRANGWTEPGQSPRVRGNLLPPEPARGPRGSIPAGAGKPSRRARSSYPGRVNPRGCGETRQSKLPRTGARGQSPRVRGNLGGSVEFAGDPGSIPAGAGKPCRATRRTAGTRVNPRGCGETRRLFVKPWIAKGQSPRVRGNLHRPHSSPGRRGSIPAGAGKPSSRSARRPGTRVNPRGCGETVGVRFTCTRNSGQSPRVRGNRSINPLPPPASGSIPAGAGKPVLPDSDRRRSRVNPRGCGETDALEDLPDEQQGQSPRVRGNLGTIEQRHVGQGSIPAGAGKPTGAPLWVRRIRVNPRGCGETRRWSRARPRSVGQSPRVRGNHRPDQPGDLRRGSIPAGAGKPSR